MSGLGLKRFGLCGSGLGPSCSTVEGLAGSSQEAPLTDTAWKLRFRVSQNVEVYLGIVKTQTLNRRESGVQGLQAFKCVHEPQCPNPKQSAEPPALDPKLQSPGLGWPLGCQNIFSSLTLV